ncbi:LPS assembly lipoprotein LptE [Yoonia sp. 208BN28-4]|uniref:LPS assembly lipoprotein LptE n=1 Tax=Yoonia sp. 208BN28-4 TaxID=3126505 RepID=UPI003098576B
MSSKTRIMPPRRFALLGLLALGACGFTPVYSPGGAGDALQNATSLVTPETVAGFALRQQLESRLGRARSDRFTLETTLDQSRTPATITVDGDTTRFNLVGTAGWVLTDRATGAVYDGTVETFTSYATTGSTVATQAARADARDRLSVALADMIVAQLIIAVPAQ